MIDNENILDDISGAALWCGADCDPTDLARYASVALEHNVAAISVAPMSVGVVWPWLENKNIPIFAWFYPRARGAAGASEIVASINQAFKQGADGAQVFVSLQNLDEFVSQLYLIRDDLFFNKAAFVGVDICEIGPFDWNSVFSALRKMRATGLVCALARDDGDASDFVGRVYAALSAWDAAGDMDLHFVTGKNPVRVEQAMRLVQSVRPELAPRVKFFVNV